MKHRSAANATVCDLEVQPSLNWERNYLEDLEHYWNRKEVSIPRTITATTAISNRQCLLWPTRLNNFCYLPVHILWYQKPPILEAYRSNNLLQTSKVSMHVSLNCNISSVFEKEQGRRKQTWYEDTCMWYGVEMYVSSIFCKMWNKR